MEIDKLRKTEKRLDWMKVVLVVSILIFITINCYFLTMQFGNRTIEYRDRVVEKECPKPVVECTEKSNIITCQLPEGKKLDIVKMTLYNMSIK